MKISRTLVGTATVAVGVVCALLLANQESIRLSAQEKEAPRKKAAAKEKGESKAKTAPKAAAKAASKDESQAKTVRLPNHYGDLGLSEDQKEQVRAIVATYDAKIEALQQQIAQLKQKREAEAEAILTDAQKEQLAQARAAKKAKGDESKPKVAKTKSRRNKDDDSAKTEEKDSATKKSAN